MTDQLNPSKIKIDALVAEHRAKKAAEAAAIAAQSENAKNPYLGDIETRNWATLPPVIGRHYNYKDYKENKENISYTVDEMTETSFSSVQPEASLRASPLIGSAVASETILLASQESQDEEVTSDLEEDTWSSINGEKESENVGSEISEENNLADTPRDFINDDNLQKALFTYFHNKRGHKHKISALIEFKDASGTVWKQEFTAALTESIKDFKKYLPDFCSSEMCEEVLQLRSSLQELGRTNIRFGKFAQNAKVYESGELQTRQLEPYSYCIVAQNPTTELWDVCVSLYKFAKSFPMVGKVSVNQKRAGVIATTPLYVKKELLKKRPLTFAQKVMAANKGMTK